ESMMIWNRTYLVGALIVSGFPANGQEQMREMPHYDHILVIVAENHGYDQIIDNSKAPNINRFAKEFGLATNYYGIVHPSKANYIAMIGGDTFGIHDDDAYYCKIGGLDRYCPSAAMIDPYVDHTVDARSLVDQLREQGLTWKGYYQSIPEAGSRIVYFPD